MGNQTKVLVTGAGGFIGHHLVSYLKSLGYWVRGADAKAPEFCANAADEFKLIDLRRWEDCLAAATGIDEVYALAADMGGMGFISAHHAQILYNNAIINLHTLEAARQSGVRRYLYTANGGVTPITRGCVLCSTGSRRFLWKRGYKGHMPGSRRGSG